MRCQLFLKNKRDLNLRGVKAAVIKMIDEIVCTNSVVSTLIFIDLRADQPLRHKFQTARFNETCLVKHRLLSSNITPLTSTILNQNHKSFLPFWCNSKTAPTMYNFSYLKPKAILLSPTYNNPGIISITQTPPHPKPSLQSQPTFAAKTHKIRLSQKGHKP